MLLPIDARKAPFKAKYIDEETPMLARWMTTSSTDGTYFVGDYQHNDVFSGLTHQQAVILEAARDVFVDLVLKVLNEPPRASSSQVFGG